MLIRGYLYIANLNVIMFKYAVFTFYFRNSLCIDIKYSAYESGYVKTARFVISFFLSFFFLKKKIMSAKENKTSH